MSDVVKKSVIIKPVIVILDGKKDKTFTLSNALRELGYEYTKETTDKAKEEWHKPWRNARSALLKVTPESPTVTVKGKKDGKDHTLTPA